MDEFKITNQEIDENNVKSAPTHNGGEDPQANKNIFDKLPELIAARFNGFVDRITAKFMEYYTKKEVDNAIDTRVTAIGAGDMQKAVYDADGDGVADNAKQLDGHNADYFATSEDVVMAHETAAAARATADAAMPVAGGVFAGDVAAYSENRATSGLRNIEIRTTDTDGGLQATNKIIMVRK